MKLKSESLIRSWLPLLSYLLTDDDEEESDGFPGPTFALWERKKMEEIEWKSVREPIYSETGTAKPARNIKFPNSNLDGILDSRMQCLDVINSLQTFVEAPHCHLRRQAGREH